MPRLLELSAEVAILSRVSLACECSPIINSNDQAVFPNHFWKIWYMSLVRSASRTRFVKQISIQSSGSERYLSRSPRSFPRCPCCLRESVIDCLDIIANSVFIRCPYHIYSVTERNKMKIKRCARNESAFDAQIPMYITLLSLKGDPSNKAEQG